MTGIARVIGLLIALALLLSLFLPLVGASAQETDPEEDVATTEALAEVPTTGARRPGPIILAASRVATPESEPEPVEGVAPIALQVDSVGVDAPIELGSVADGVMQDPSGPWVVSWYEPLGKVGEDGKNYEYAVQWTQSYLADQLTPEVIQGEIVGDTGEETLTLITCGGEFDPATGEYNERWVVRANLISV